MAKLYIANTSRQNAQFTARLPEGGTVLRKGIQAGRQEIVYDGELYVIDEIIRQNSQYGLKRADEVKRTKSFTGLAYRIDREITLENFMIADDQNYDIKEAEGAEIRKRAAITANMVTEAAAKMNGGSVRKSSIAIQDLSKDDPSFNEVYSAEKPEDAVISAPRKSRKRN